jgi:hypothetical protein
MVSAINDQCKRLANLLESKPNKPSRMQQSVVGEEEDVPKKDYSRREADLYYRASGIFGDEILSAEEPNLSSLNPLVSGDSESTSVSPVESKSHSRGEERVRALLNMAVGKLIPRRKEPEPVSRGFEVLNRRKIQPSYSRVPGADTSSPRLADGVPGTSAAVVAASATKSSDGQEEPFIFIPESLGGTSKGSGMGLRIDTGAGGLPPGQLVTAQALSRAPSAAAAESSPMTQPNM